MDLIINKNQSDMATSFYIIQNNRIALAELSLYSKEMVEDYLLDITIGRQEIEEIFNRTEKIYFFNRLNVPEQLRNQGISLALLKETLNFIAQQDALLINTVNSYGELTQEQLIKWYEKHGMFVGNEQGLLFFHQDLSPKAHLKKKLK